MNKISIAVVVGGLAVAAFGYEVAPKDKSKEWNYWPTLMQQRAAGVTAAANAGGALDVLFIGDSELDFFNGDPGARARAYYFSDRRICNFAIGGDTPANVLWRIEKCPDLAKLDPKVCVVNGAVNEMWKGLKNDPECVERAVKGAVALCEKVHGLYPKAKLLYMNIFTTANGNARPAVLAARKELEPFLAKLGYVETVTVPDAVFQNADGSINKTVMADGVHPTEVGYVLVSEIFEPAVAKALGVTPKKPNPLLKTELLPEVVSGELRSYVLEFPAPVEANAAVLNVAQCGGSCDHATYVVEHLGTDGVWEVLARRSWVRGRDVVEFAKPVKAAKFRIRFADGCAFSSVPTFSVYNVK